MVYGAATQSSHCSHRLYAMNAHGYDTIIFFFKRQKGEFDL